MKLVAMLKDNQSNQFPIEGERKGCELGDSHLQQNLSDRSGATKE